MTEPKNTPLDSFNEAVLRLDDAISGAADQIAGSLCDHDHENALGWLDSARHSMWKSLLEHIPGYEIDEMRGCPYPVPNRYENGDPIQMTVNIDGHLFVYYPRRDGEVDVFVADMQHLLPAKRHLTAVEGD